MLNYSKCTPIKAFILIVAFSILVLVTNKDDIILLTKSFDTTFIFMKDTVDSKTKVIKPYIYLVQASGRRTGYQFVDVLSRNDSDLVLLTYDTSILPESLQNKTTHLLYMFLPNSSWSSGRNALIDKAKSLETQQGWKYKYFILCDGDVVLSTAPKHRPTDPFQVFHEFLEREEPAIGFPTGKRCGGRRKCGDEPTVATCDFDAAINAFHRDVVDVVLPYVEAFDSISWYWSQVAVWYLACSQFSGLTLQSCALGCKNTDHTSKYPRDMWKNIGSGDVNETLVFEARKRLPPKLKDCINTKKADWVETERSPHNVSYFLANTPACIPGQMWTPALPTN